MTKYILFGVCLGVGLYQTVMMFHVCESIEYEKYVTRELNKCLDLGGEVISIKIETKPPYRSDTKCFRR